MSMKKQLILLVILLALGVAFYIMERSGQSILPINWTGETGTETEAPREGGCYVGGCSGQICSDEEGVVSTCEYKAEYACYQNAKCERQSDGKCGWTPTEELQMCLNTAQ